MGEILNKIASIIAQGAANAVFDEIKITESEKMDSAIKKSKVL